MTTTHVELATLAAYVDTETERWREWFAAHPQALGVAQGPGSDGTVRVLIKHIFAVELRYAQRLLGEPVSGYEQLPDETVEDLWTIHRAAASLRDRYRETAIPEALEQVLVSETRKLGRIEARAHTVLVHTLVHGIRHWAQIATLLRQNGHAGTWEHDWLLSPAVR